MLVLAACASKVDSRGWCDINGSVSNTERDTYEGLKVYLTTPSTSPVLLSGDQSAQAGVIDSCEVSDGRFRFALVDSSKSRVLQLVLPAHQLDSFPSTLPVVIEHGVVSVRMGSSVSTGGTALNDKLQDFLLARSNLFDAVTTDTTGNALSRFAGEFSKLLLTTLNQNKDNVLGEYIYQQYHEKFKN